MEHRQTAPSTKRRISPITQAACFSSDHYSPRLREGSRAKRGRVAQQVGPAMEKIPLGPSRRRLPDHASRSGIKIGSSLKFGPCVLREPYFELVLRSCRNRTIMILFTSYLSRAPDPRRYQTDPTHRPTVSLLGQKGFPAFGGAGNWLQAIEPAWRPAPKTAQRGRNRAKFSNIPC